MIVWVSNGDWTHLPLAADEAADWSVMASYGTSVSPVCVHSSSHGLAWLLHLAGGRLLREWRVHALLNLG